ncbi:MAG: hypothetical protein AB7N91_32955 [Candidatus Tectimicrobiota bacterium]
MAIFHLAVRHGSRRDGRSAQRLFRHVTRPQARARDRTADRVVAVGQGGMPAWAEADPAALWRAVDTYERANGRLYTLIDLALPRELTRPAQLALFQAFVAQAVGPTHPCAWAVRVRQALDGAD